MGDLRWIAGDFKAYPLTTDEKPFIEFHGSRVIPPGHNLRALTLLDWMGKRFNAAQFPSCKLDNTPPSKLIAGLRAGNYLYAASVMFAPLPNSSPQKLQRRYSSAKQHVNTAQKLLPDLEIRLEDFR
jgi:hypothetical protein